MLYTLFEILINLYEGALMIYFMRQRLRSTANAPLWIDAAFSIGIGACFTLYSFIDIPFTDTWIFLLPLAYTFVTHRGTLLSKILCTLTLGFVFILLVGLIPSVYMSLMNIDETVVLQSTPQRIGCVICYNLILTVILFTLAKVGKSGSKLIPPFFDFFVCVILFLQLVITETVFVMQEKASHDIYLIVIYLCLFLSAVVIFVFCEVFRSNTTKRHVGQLLKADEENNNRYSAELKAYYERMITLQHDLHKQINTTGQLLSVADHDGCMQQLNELRTMLDKRNPFMTGNMSVDAVITAKRAVAQQHGIRFDFEPFPMSIPPINEVEFCTLLFNILDNAIEGALRVDKSKKPDLFITLKLQKAWDMFCIKCANSCNSADIKRNGDEFLSSKQDDGLHGLGTRSIRQTAADHSGQCIFSVDNDTFTVLIELPIEDSDYAP